MKTSHSSCDPSRIVHQDEIKDIIEFLPHKHSFREIEAIINQYFQDIYNDFKNKLVLMKSEWMSLLKDRETIDLKKAEEMKELKKNYKFVLKNDCDTIKVIPKLNGLEISQIKVIFKKFKEEAKTMMNKYLNRLNDLNFLSNLKNNDIWIGKEIVTKRKEDEKGISFSLENKLLSSAFSLLIKTFPILTDSLFQITIRTMDERIKQFSFG